jgi:hypothetical protein
MEKITEGKLTILKGDNLVIVSKKMFGDPLNGDIWTFADGLVGKGYELLSINMMGAILIITFKNP